MYKYKIINDSNCIKASFGSDNNFMVVRSDDELSTNSIVLIIDDEDNAKKLVRVLSGAETNSYTVEQINNNNYKRYLDCNIIKRGFDLLGPDIKSKINLFEDSSVADLKSIFNGIVKETVDSLYITLSKEVSSDGFDSMFCVDDKESEQEIYMNMISVYAIGEFTKDMLECEEINLIVNKNYGSKGILKEILHILSLGGAHVEEEPKIEIEKYSELIDMIVDKVADRVADKIADKESLKIENNIRRNMTFTDLSCSPAIL